MLKLLLTGLVFFLRQLISVLIEFGRRFHLVDLEDAVEGLVELGEGHRLSSGGRKVHQLEQRVQLVWVYLLRQGSRYILDILGLKLFFDLGNLFLLGSS